MATHFVDHDLLATLDISQLAVLLSLVEAFRNDETDALIRAEMDQAHTEIAEVFWHRAATMGGFVIGADGVPRPLPAPVALGYPVMT